MDLPLDQSRMTVPLISAGTTVVRLTEFDKDVAPQDRVQQRDRRTGLPCWQCFVVSPAEDGERPESFAVKILSRQAPIMPPFGEPVEFTDLTVTPWLADGSRRVSLAFRATDVAACRERKIQAAS